MKLFVMMLTLLSLSGAWAQVAPGEVAQTASAEAAESVVEDCDGAQNGSRTDTREGGSQTGAQGTPVGQE